MKKNILTPLSIEIIKNSIQQNSIIIDTRPINKFTEGFIPGSIFLGLGERFTEWAYAIIPLDTSIILINEPGKEDEAYNRLLKGGFEKIEGYLEGGFDTWKNATEDIDLIIEVEADELAMDIKHDKNLQVVDVRSATEFADEHIVDAINLPLNDLTDVVTMAAFDDNQNLYLHCGDNYKSVIACSLFKKQGLHNVRIVSGGWKAIKEEKSIKTKKEASALN